MSGWFAQRVGPAAEGRRVWIGLISATAVVLVVLAATVVSGAVTDPVAEVEVTVAGSTPSLLAERAVPRGDYRAFCTELEQQLAALAAVPSDEDSFVWLLRNIQLEPLITVAPAGLRPSLELLRDQRPAALAKLDQGVPLVQIDPDELPDGVLDALGLVFRSSADRCEVGSLLPGGEPGD